MKVAFAGTPEAALLVLRALAEAGHEIIAVITEPDRPAGRGQKLYAPPVKVGALRRGLPVFQPEYVNALEFLAPLRALAPEALVVMAYGQKLKPALLSLPRHGCYNVHPSLLPKYRGAAPVAWALLQGETETGVTIFRMNEGMDTGDILLQRRVAILPDENTDQLTTRLAEIGAEMAVETLEMVRTGAAQCRPQNDAEATFARALRKEDGLINWRHEAECVRNLVRAMTPWPGAFTFHHPAQGSAQRLIVLRTRVRHDVGEQAREPGTVVRADREGLLVAAADGAVELLEVKPAGGRAMDGAAFVRGRRVQVGDRLGTESNQ